MRKLHLAAALAIVLGASAALAQTYKPGDAVEAYSPMSGKWEKGKIAAIDSARYMFKADDKTLANEYFGVTPDKIRPIGAAAAPAAPKAVTPVQPNAAAAPKAAPTPGPAPKTTAAAATAPAPAQGAGCGLAPAGGAAIQIAGAADAPMGKGLFPNGEKMGTPGQTNYKNNRSGQRSIVAVAPPGVETPIGRFNLMVGGTWSTISQRDLGNGVTERSLNWNVPEKANVLVINADGSWYRKSGSQKFHGRWIDLGQNVVQLIGYDDDDWTGSVQNSPTGCRMEMRSPLGQNEWRRRF